MEARLDDAGLGGTGLGFWWAGLGGVGFWLGEAVSWVRLWWGGVSQNGWQCGEGMGD